MSQIVSKVQCGDGSKIVIWEDINEQDEVCVKIKLEAPDEYSMEVTLSGRVAEKTGALIGLHGKIVRKMGEESTA